MGVNGTLLTFSSFQETNSHAHSPVATYAWLPHKLFHVCVTLFHILNEQQYISGLLYFNVHAYVGHFVGGQTYENNVEKG